jgi:hypothetical protein
VAQAIFDEVEVDREKMYRAIEVGGRLETVEDALDRLGNIGGFLASKDACFSYPASTHEADEQAIERYGPEFVLDATEDEAGQLAAAKLRGGAPRGQCR